MKTMREFIKLHKEKGLHWFDRDTMVEKAKIKVNQRLNEQGYIDFSDNKSCGLNNNSEIIILLSNEKPKIEQIGGVS